MQGRLYSILLCVVLLSGCDEGSTSSPPPAGPRPPEIGTRFDPTTTGTIHGRVRWQGAKPRIPSFRSIDNPLTDQPNPPPPRDWPNPNAPLIDEENNVTSAVVFLRGIDPSRGRPWDHAPVRVELRDHHFDLSGRFARVGDEVEFVSRQQAYHSVQLRGAAFSALTLPQPDRPRRQALSRPGVVELQSGAGLFWMRAHLFVAEHPYHATTEDRGTFLLRDVPEGEYDLVVWHANWRVRREERNAESFRIVQVRYEPAIEVIRQVKVVAGREATLDVPIQ